jgi:L-ascorbate metabolism protein UlaG (beta-lactamase superfamily)
MKKIMIVILAVIAALAAFALYFVNTPQFGRAPSGARLERIMKSPNFKNGVFQNQEPIVNHLEDGFLVSFYKFIFEKREDLRPQQSIPHVDTDLKALGKDRDFIVLLGHSSFLLQLSGHRFLVDPVFNGYVSPVSFLMTAFDGSNPFKVSDLPDDIDTVLLSHDHWDHLEYSTTVALKDKIGHVVTGLGNGEYYEMWGISPKKIHELDYGEEVSLADNIKITVTPARHFSGRFLKENPTEPASFVIATDRIKFFYSGDSGYGKHFKEIGEKYGPFDFAVMEDGQYDMQWHNVHMLPEEVLMASSEIKAKAVLPVHNSKFVLANHNWKDPLESLEKFSDKYNVELVTPLIGQVIYLDQLPASDKWWQKLK